MRKHTVGKRAGLLRHAIPWLLARDLRALGQRNDPRRLLAVYALVIVALSAAGLLLMEPWPYILVLCLAGLLFAPSFLYNTVRARHEARRFTDVTVYIKQMLYAFGQSRKVLDALGEVSLLFRPGSDMRPTLDRAVMAISDPTAAKGDVEEPALRIIEEQYPSRYVTQLHRFLLTVERTGGDFTSSTKLLLDSCAAWESRTRRLQDLRRTKRRDILISLIASVALVAFMLRMLSDGEATAATPLVASVNTLMIVVCMMIYLSAERRLSGDLLAAPQADDERLATTYVRYVHYDPRRELRGSLLWSLLPLGIIAFGMWQRLTAVAVVGAVLLPVMLMQHEISHRLKRRELTREIAVAFPQWLMEIALLLQTENVQVAIFRSVDTAFPVLRPALEELREALQRDPTGTGPYFSFLETFDMPDVTMSMQMLYSLSQGTSNADTGGDQVAAIVRNNNASLDRAEDVRTANRMASMSVLFYAPTLLGSAVLLVDMSVYMVTLLSSLGGVS